MVILMHCSRVANFGWRLFQLGKTVTHRELPLVVLTIADHQHAKRQIRSANLGAAVDGVGETTPQTPSRLSYVVAIAYSEI